MVVNFSNFMKKPMRKKTLQLLSILIISAFFLGLFYNFNYSYTQNNIKSPKISQSGNESLKISQNFDMFEFTEISDAKENISSIDIEFPLLKWNITDIELNFTDIKLNCEIKTIEDEEFGSKLIYNKNPTQKRLALGVQLNISIPTVIYGVYIYGYKGTGTDEIIKFQIMGYDEENNKPNDTIYRTLDLNMSFNPNWYYQNFSTNPITLPKGNYSLVMNGTEISSKNTKYYWILNNINALIPNLHTSEYENSWSNGDINSTFLYKLVQKVERSYNPEDINMTAEINGNLLKILNGVEPGLGNLTLLNTDFYSNDENFHIPIYNNNSIQLIFNLSYSIRIYNKFISNGSITIRESSDILWSLEPSINRCDGNYSVRLEYPLSWYNLTVFKDGFNITLSDGVVINGHAIYILNDIITEGAKWNIIATSKNVDFDLNLPKTVFEGGQHIKISVGAPEVKGNLLFVLIDALNFEEYTEEVEVSSDKITFFYELPSRPPTGEWKILVFWFCDTDAGVQIEKLSVIVHSDPLIVTLVSIIIIIISIIAGFISYQLKKRYKIIKEAGRKKIFNKYMNVLNLNYIMISAKKSGLNVYEESFVGEKLDPTLISGYLAAINIFGIEITNSYEQSQTVVKLDYKNLKILMSDFKDFRINVILKENPSNDFLRAITSISYKIDSKYGKLIENFNGNSSNFIGIRELIEKHLYISFISPLKISKTENIKLSQSETLMFIKAKRIMKKNNLHYIFTTFLMPNQIFNLKNAEIISNLIEKKVLKPINLSFNK